MDKIVLEGPATIVSSNTDCKCQYMLLEPEKVTIPVVDPSIPIPIQVMQSNDFIDTFKEI